MSLVTRSRMQRSIVSISSILILQCCTAINIVDFDDYGSEYIRTQIRSGETKTYAVSLQNDEYIYMTGSTSMSYQLVHAPSGTVFESTTDMRQYEYFLLQPDNTQSVCHSSSYANCTFHLLVSNTATSSRSIWLRFNRNLVVEPHRVYANTIQLRKRRRYALQLHEQDCPILVKLTPNQNYDEMDIDLYGYTENAFSSYYFPNQAERNHIKNYIEQLLISSTDSYFQDNQWHFFEVYGSTDSHYDDMDYTFEVITNYEPDSLLKRILLIFAFTIASSFIIGILFSFVCTFRNQILYFLRIRSTPHRNGASKRQIRKLKVITYKHDEDLDSNECCICLEEYQLNDKVRILKCKHCFHVHCSDEWLFINNKCPLCQQNISDAKDVRQTMLERPLHQTEGIELNSEEVQMNANVDDEDDDDDVDDEVHQEIHSRARIPSISLDP